MSNLLALKDMMRNDVIKNRFQEVLQEQAPTFMASIVNAVTANSLLQQCDPMTVWGAGMVAAALKLPVDPNLGFAYIIPYKDKDKGYIANFQCGYKGFIQLGMRSGQYKRMNASEVYSDELKAFNPITGEIEFADMSDWKLRENGEPKDIIGYYAYFILHNGYMREEYWTAAKIDKHAKKYSQTYKKGYGKWVDDFDSMAKKTVIKALLSKWGVLSVEMQEAITKDQSSVIEGEVEYPDNPNDERQREEKSIIFKGEDGKHE